MLFSIWVSQIRGRGSNIRRIRIQIVMMTRTYLFSTKLRYRKKVVEPLAKDLLIDMLERLEDKLENPNATINKGQ